MKPDLDNNTAVMMETNIAGLKIRVMQVKWEGNIFPLNFVFLTL